MGCSASAQRTNTTTKERKSRRKEWSLHNMNKRNNGGRDLLYTCTAQDSAAEFQRNLRLSKQRSDEHGGSQEDNNTGQNIGVDLLDHDGDSCCVPPPPPRTSCCATATPDAAITTNTSASKVHVAVGAKCSSACATTGKPQDDPSRHMMDRETARPPDTTTMIVHTTAPVVAAMVVQPLGPLLFRNGEESPLYDGRGCCTDDGSIAPPETASTHTGGGGGGGTDEFFDSVSSIDILRDRSSPKFGTRSRSGSHSTSSAHKHPSNNFRRQPLPPRHCRTHTHSCCTEDDFDYMYGGDDDDNPLALSPKNLSRTNSGGDGLW